MASYLPRSKTFITFVLPLFCVATAQSYQKCSPTSLSGKCPEEDFVIDATGLLDSASLMQAYSPVAAVRIRDNADLVKDVAVPLPQSIALSENVAKDDLQNADGITVIQHASLTEAAIHDLGIRFSQFCSTWHLYFSKLSLLQKALIEPYAHKVESANSSPIIQEVQEEPDLTLLGTGGTSPRARPVLESPAGSDNVVVLVVGVVLVLAVFGFAMAMILQPASAGRRLNAGPNPYASGTWSTRSPPSSTGSFDNLKQAVDPRRSVGFSEPRSSFVSLMSGSFLQAQDDQLKSSASIPARHSVDSLGMSFGSLNFGKTVQGPPSLLARALKPVQGMLVPNATVPLAMRPLSNFARRVLARRPGPQAPDTVLSPDLLVPEGCEVVLALPSLLSASNGANYREYKIADEQGRPILGVVVDRTQDAGNPGMSERIALVDLEGRRPHGYCELRRAAGHGAPQATILSADLGEQFFLGEAPNPRGLRALLVCSAAEHGARRMVVQVHGEQGRGASVSSPERFCAAMVEGPGFEREGGEYYKIKIGPSVDAGLVILALLALDRLPATSEGPAAARFAASAKAKPAAPGVVRTQAMVPAPGMVPVAIPGLQLPTAMPVPRRPPGPPQGPQPHSQQHMLVIGSNSGMPLGTPASQPRWSL